MGYDAGDGSMTLRGDGLVVTGPSLPSAEVAAMRKGLIERIARGNEAVAITDPIAASVGSMGCVHPLGGCPMGATGADGVVDDEGRVFAGDGDDVHDGLFVLDGAVVPTAVGVNPLMTICVIAERAMAILAEKMGAASLDARKDDVLLW